MLMWRVIKWAAFFLFFRSSVRSVSDVSSLIATCPWSGCHQLPEACLFEENKYTTISLNYRLQMFLKALCNIYPGARAVNLGIPFQTVQTHVNPLTDEQTRPHNDVPHRTLPFVVQGEVKHHWEVKIQICVWMKSIKLSFCAVHRSSFSHLRFQRTCRTSLGKRNRSPGWRRTREPKQKAQTRREWPQTETSDPTADTLRNVSVCHTHSLIWSFRDDVIYVPRESLDNRSSKASRVRRCSRCDSSLWMRLNSTNPDHNQKTKDS